MIEQLQQEDHSGYRNFLVSNCEDGNSCDQRISVSDHTNGLHHANSKSESVVLNMERFSHLLDKDVNANSRIARNLSRKGSIRGTEKKTTAANDSVANSPRSTGMLEKPVVVAIGAMDHATVPQADHEVTFTNPSAAAADSKLGGKQFSFRRSSHSGIIIDPRRILFFFATLSCMGTVLLIYFTLSMGKVSVDDNALN